MSIAAFLRDRLRAALAALARRLSRVDPGEAVVSTVMLLLAIGTVMVFSASFFHRSVGGDPYAFLRRQALWLPIAILAGLFTAHLDYRFLARVHVGLLGGTAVLLLMVFVPGIGLPPLNGARRWIDLRGGFQFQPSELAKLAAVIFIAGFLARDPERARRFWKGFLPSCGGVFLLVGLILIEPDLGTAVFVLLLAGVVMMLAGMRKRFIFLSGLLAAPPLAAFMAWRWEQVQPRLLAFVEPERIYQVKQSLLGFGSGGLLGVGLGKSGMKLKFLPEPQTDFIFAIIGEELGLAGSLSVLALFLVLLWAGAAIACRARDVFGFLLASGIVTALTLQAAINIAVVTASAPTKGIPLPFITFGGSGMVMALAQVGLLISVHRLSRAGARAGEVSGAPAAASMAPLTGGAVG